MIYLILAFCSSALISIVMRYGEGRIQNNISALAVNYSICLLLSLIYSAGSGSFAVSQDSAKSVLPNYYSASVRSCLQEQPVWRFSAKK